MEKKSLKLSTKTKRRDMSKPIEVQIDPDDCFGQLFNLLYKECRLCADQWACQETKESFKIPKDTGLLGAIRDFDFTYVLKEVREAPIKYDKLIELVKSDTRIPDTRTVELLVENFILKNKLVLDGNVVKTNL